MLRGGGSVGYLYWIQRHNESRPPTTHRGCWSRRGTCSVGKPERELKCDWQNRERGERSSPFLKGQKMTVVDEYVQAIKSEKDPKKIIELWSKATKSDDKPNLSLKEIVSIHKKCSKEITAAALSLEKKDYE